MAIGGPGGNYFDQLSLFTMLVIKASLHACPTVIYDRLARYLSNAGASSLVINLNYDTLLEEAAERLSSQGMAQFTYSLGSHIPVYGHNTNVANPSMVIIKPHGSFNAYDCDRCNAVSYSHPTMSPLFQPGHPCYSRCQNPGHKNAKCLDPWCFPYAPTTQFAKIRSSQVASGVVQGLGALLCNVEEISSLGYGFPILPSGQFVDLHLIDAVRTKPIRVVSRSPSSAADIAARLQAQGIQAVADPSSGVDAWLHAQES